MAVSMFSTRDTYITCIDDGPRYSTILALGFHFDIIPPNWGWFWRAYTGHTKDSLFLRLGAIVDTMKRLKGLIPSSLSGNIFWIWFVFIKVYGRRESLTVHEYIYFE